MNLLSSVRRYWLPALFACGVILLVMSGGILERMFVYFPSREVRADPSQIGLSYTDVRALTDDGIAVHGWFVPSPGARHTLLIFHGNAGNISHRLEWIRVLHDLGAHVMIVDYRGYGKSGGSPVEQGLYRDALAAYQWWATERAADRSKLILIGESLGVAVAVDLAARVRVDGIVLQSGFTTAWDMAKTILPLGFLQPLLGIQFDSEAKIRKVDCPKLVIHGNRDEIVPFALGRKLFESAPPPKEFYAVEGAGHNDLLEAAGPEYAMRLRRFLEVTVGP